MPSHQVPPNNIEFLSVKRAPMGQSFNLLLKNFFIVMGSSFARPVTEAEELYLTDGHNMQKHMQVKKIGPSGG
jgi:hypothetical protein